MTNERQEALERLQQELLEDDLLGEDAEESNLPDNLLEDLPAALFHNSEPAEPDEPEFSLEDILSEGQDEVMPAFEDPNQIHTPAEPMEYCNYSNDYGRDSEEAAEQEKRKQKIEDNWQIILMAVASFLCLGIIGVLIYWMEVFLK